MFHPCDVNTEVTYTHQQRTQTSFKTNAAASKCDLPPILHVAAVTTWTSVNPICRPGLPSCCGADPWRGDPSEHRAAALHPQLHSLTSSCTQTAPDCARADEKDNTGIQQRLLVQAFRHTAGRESRRCFIFGRNLLEAHAENPQCY